MIVGSPMGINCAPFIADLFLYSFTRMIFRLTFTNPKIYIVDMLHDTSRHLDYILTIDNPKYN